MNKIYYRKVETYYDEDASGFDTRYWQNAVLQRIRQDFREEVKRHHFREMLEIGFGTGLDMEHFATVFPEAGVAGIDISGEMQKLASKRLSDKGLQHAMACKGSVEDLSALFPGRQFDMVYVFFGALNTVEDIQQAAGSLWKSTAPGGTLVLSFVNKYYLGGMLMELAKLRFRAAFARLKPVWGGYSPTKYLPSKCYTPSEIKIAFAGYRLLKRKGYSIIHPAWYYHRLNHLIRPFSRWLWAADRQLNKTFLWRYGEYTLFVFQKPDHI